MSRPAVCFEDCVTGFAAVLLVIALCVAWQICWAFGAWLARKYRDRRTDRLMRQGFKAANKYFPGSFL